MDENKFTVKDVSAVEKSKVEIEEQLLKEHEEKTQTETPETTVETVEATTEKPTEQMKR